jgi:hypothetical protein
MWSEHDVLVIAAACSVEPVFANECREILGSAWEADDPEYLKKRIDSHTRERGFGTLCERLSQMPDSARWASVERINVWLCTYRVLEAVKACAGTEDFATAVAFTPAVADIFPRDQKLREAMAHEVGSSLAAAEHTGLMYGVATRIAGFSYDARAKEAAAIGRAVLQVVDQRRSE